MNDELKALFAKLADELSRNKLDYTQVAIDDAVDEYSTKAMNLFEQYAVKEEWAICTDFLNKGGSIVFRGFVDKDSALVCRSFIEQYDPEHRTFAVDELNQPKQSKEERSE